MEEVIDRIMNSEEINQFAGSHNRIEIKAKIGSYIVMCWLLAIAMNLLTTGMFYDLAMRDVEIAIGAFVLAQLTAVRERQQVPVADSHVLQEEQFAESR